MTLLLIEVCECVRMMRIHEHRAKESMITVVNRLATIGTMCVCFFKWVYENETFSPVSMLLYLLVLVC